MISKRMVVPRNSGSRVPAPIPRTPMGVGAKKKREGKTHQHWKGAKGIPTKGIGKSAESHEFQGVFRVFSVILIEFQGIFPHALSGYALWALPT